jgi:hypothetical protein
MLVPLGDTLNIKASTINRGLIVAPGKRGLPFITGDVEISNLNYNQDVHIIEMSDLNISQMAKTKRTIHHPRLLDKNNDYFEYDIKLHGDKNISIINNLADAKLKIDDTIDPLRFVGSNQHYGFLGSVLSKKGEVRFAGKTLDPLRPDNPYFTVSADVSVRDWKISILAEGTVEEYTVTLSSQPHLTQEDIIILLLTGLLKEEHSQYGSQGLSMSLAPIIENVSSGVIPVEINVYSEYSEKAGTDTTRIALGKKLTDDIWLKVSSSIGQGQDVEGTVSYKINDNLSLSASYDNKSELSSVGNWGVDLKFRLEF